MLQWQFPVVVNNSFIYYVFHNYRSPLFVTVQTSGPCRAHLAIFDFLIRAFGTYQSPVPVSSEHLVMGLWLPGKNRGGNLVYQLDWTDYTLIRKSFRVSSLFHLKIFVKPRAEQFFSNCLDCTFKSSKKLNSDILDLPDKFTIPTNYRLCN